LLKTLFAIVVVGLLAAAGYCGWYVATPIAVSSLPAAFDIAPGMRLRAAAQRIEDGGVAVGRLQFELLARALGRAADVKAGSYELTVAPTPLELLDKLTRGDVLQAEVRFIEGWTFRQMRAALAEGLFFPDTYLFAKGTSDLRVLQRAYRAMQRHLAREWQAREPSLPYKAPYEALIMASVIEKETGQAAERDLIAGALVNRLRIGMLLQVDPTVIYGLGDAFNGNLKKIHLLTDGPYNTYTRGGLPPTPIAAPGLASLRAALRPAKTGALYYVARGDGSSEFSRTLDEHNRAVRKYQLNGGRK
jgi:UPF0755 protein